ncbi:MAG: sulfite exporter TauE/SafE family protein [Bacteroidetes bacterium]|nr:sulfite exporter TauE/SafE family protein [Bacteroidota bacterium]
MVNYRMPSRNGTAKVGRKQVLLIANGDLRLTANQNCWAAQKEMEASLAGAVAAAAGVGGGVIMVPAFNGLARLPLKVAAGTSTAAITIIALTGVLVFALLGLGADVPPTASGYVDIQNALLLGAPAMLTARIGVSVAHRINVRWVRYSFAAFAAAVAAKLIWSTLG